MTEIRMTELHDKLAALLTGLDPTDIIPELIVASAQALVIQADEDKEHLGEIVLKFCLFVQEQALDMADEK